MSVELSISQETWAYIVDVVTGEMGMSIDQYITGTVLLSLGMNWAPECRNNPLWDDDFYGL